MRIDQLVYLVEISRFGSISLAAEHLHISQPTISQAINALEVELGKKLFYRSRIGTQPTEEGKTIINKAKEILNKIEEIRESADDSKRLTGTLSLAGSSSFCMSILPKALVIYKEKFPGVTIKISEGGSFEIERYVLEGKVDLGFTATVNQRHYDDHEDFSFKQFAYAQVVACVGKKSPLSEKKSISFKEIAEHPIVTFKPGVSMYQNIIKLVSRYGKPNILFKSGNTATGKQILSEGIGIGFCSEMIIKHDPYFLSGLLVPIPISDEDLKLFFGWLMLKKQYLSSVSREFIKTLKTEFHMNL